MMSVFFIAALLATLDWVPIGDGVESFIIMRSLNNGPWEEIATVGPTVRRFIDNKRVAGADINHYCYEVAAYGKGVLLGTSPAGCKDEPAIVATPQAPVAPSGLTVK